MTTSNKKKRKQKKLQVDWWLVLRFVMLASLLGAVLIAANSCKPKQQLTTTTETLSVQKDKLTPVAVPGEKATLRARFECDSLNNVLLKNFNELKSKNMNSSFSFANGELDYTAQTEPDTVFIPSTDYWYYINRHINTTVTITERVPVYKNKFGFLDWTGLLFWIVLTAFAVFKLATKTPVISNIKKHFKSIK